MKRLNISSLQQLVADFILFIPRKVDNHFTTLNQQNAQFTLAECCKFVLFRFRVLNCDNISLYIKDTCTKSLQFFGLFFMTVYCIPLFTSNTGVVSWHRQLRHHPLSCPLPVHVGFVMDKLAVVQVLF
jgi:hypothetical protein